MTSRRGSSRPTISPRLHAAFLPHVADFAVEFAADFVDELTIDPLTGAVSGSAASPSPDGLPDLEPDRTLDGSIKWYTAMTRTQMRRLTHREAVRR